jgi:ABC-type antimicrobial peptide transport system permease subunit
MSSSVRIDAIGIYGVLASLVSQQTRDIAIRMALGASASGVIWMVFRRALILMAAGIGFGLAGAFGITRLMASLLYEVRPTDAVAFFGAALVLTFLALLPGLAPAWRATHVDPVGALKME